MSFSDEDSQIINNLKSHNRLESKGLAEFKNRRYYL